MKPFETLTLGDTYGVPLETALPDCDESMGGHYNPCIAAHIYPKLGQDKRSGIFAAHELAHTHVDWSAYMCYIRSVARWIYTPLYGVLSQSNVQYTRVFLEDPEFHKLNTYLADLIRRAGPVQELYAIWESIDFLQQIDYFSEEQIAHLLHRYMRALKLSYPQYDLPGLYEWFMRVRLKMGEKGESFPFEYALNGLSPTPENLQKDSKASDSSVRVDPLARFKQALRVMETNHKENILHHLQQLPDLADYFHWRNGKWIGEFKPWYGMPDSGVCKRDDGFGKTCTDNRKDRAAQDSESRLTQEVDSDNSEKNRLYRSVPLIKIVDDTIYVVEKYFNERMSPFEKKFRNFSCALCQYKQKVESMDENERVHSNPLIQVVGDKIYITEKCHEELFAEERIFYESIRQQLVHRKGLVCPFWPSTCYRSYGLECPFQSQLSMAWRATCQTYGDENWQRPSCLS